MYLYHVRWEEGSRGLRPLKKLAQVKNEKEALKEAARLCRAWGRNGEGDSLSMLHVLMGEEAGTLVIDLNKEDGVFIPRLRVASDLHRGRLFSREEEGALL